MTGFLRWAELDEEGVDTARYPFTLPVVAGLRAIDRLEFDPGVTFFVGDNGTGKSTLVEAIAVAAGFNPEGGSRNMTVSTRPSHSALHKHLRLVRGTRRPRTGYFLRAESFFNLATYLDQMKKDVGGDRALAPYGGKSLHAQSHGESFMALLSKRLKGPGLYIFDEPEAALSPSRQMAALVRIHDLVKKGAQFIIATHSPILLAAPGARILQIDGGGRIGRVDYDEAQPVAMTRDFLADPARYLRHLF